MSRQTSDREQKESETNRKKRKTDREMNRQTDYKGIE